MCTKCLPFDVHVPWGQRVKDAFNKQNQNLCTNYIVCEVTGFRLISVGLE